MTASSRKTGQDRKCETCGATFYAPARRANARFCSIPCRGVGTRRTFSCEVCGTQAYGFQNVNKRWCSRECASTARRTGETHACEVCGGKFYVPASRPTHQGRFCSTACHDVHQGRSKTEHTCKTCDGTFRWSPSRSTSYKITYCSLPCRDADPDRRAQLLAMNQMLQMRRTTRAEAAGYALLDALGVEHEQQSTFRGKFTPDALVPGARLVVQFDGDYWHDRTGSSTEPRILRRVALDKSQDAHIRACGWRVLRLWESDLRADPEGCAALLRQHLCLPA